MVGDVAIVSAQRGGSEVVGGTRRRVPGIVARGPWQLACQRREQEVDRPRYDDVVIERHVERD